ncbi:hypothetical protein HYU16_05025 [Candidatus Woesearchaeota archaeon]|nr:hypothetical protein [Candidatus Woesearchaeota archaeon]
MESEVKIRLSIPRKMHDQMKQHPEIDWNEAAVREISKQFAAAGIRVEEKGHQNPKSNHHKL